MNVSLVWATPDLDAKLAYIARVSNPDNQLNPTIEQLFAYMEREGHVSPFQMANVCVEIEAPRDISRQILRHWSIHMHELDVQEFSQRYQDVSKLPPTSLRECRMQDTKNRQSSLPCTDPDLVAWWEARQRYILELTHDTYTMALARGMAKECARVVLPEGLTPSRFYLNGTVRSWLHYIRSRRDPTTQKEHRDIGDGMLSVLRGVAPVTTRAFFPE